LANGTAHRDGAMFVMHEGSEEEHASEPSTGPIFGEQQAILAVGLRELSSVHKEVTQMAAALIFNTALALRQQGGASVSNLAGELAQCW
jgi:hypothetical protein